VTLNIEIELDSPEWGAAVERMADAMVAQDDRVEGFSFDLAEAALRALFEIEALSG
jgi:hypothetical protein